MLRIRPTTKDREAISRNVLSALPEWFGIDSALDNYVAHAASAPMMIAEVQGEVVGYVAIAEHFGTNCEPHSMGVLPALHRQGIGRALVETTARWAHDRGYAYLTVKTLAVTHRDPNYAATRLFYRKMGFQPFEVLETLWGRDLPCLLMMRRLT